MTRLVSLLRLWPEALTHAISCPTLSMFSLSLPGGFRLSKAGAKIRPFYKLAKFFFAFRAKTYATRCNAAIKNFKILRRSPKTALKIRQEGLHSTKNGRPDGRQKAGICVIRCNTIVYTSHWQYAMTRMSLYSSRMRHFTEERATGAQAAPSGLPKPPYDSSPPLLRPQGRQGREWGSITTWITGVGRIYVWLIEWENKNGS